MHTLIEWALSSTTKKSRLIGFEDVLNAIKTPDKYVLINTLSLDKQDCLIQGTLSTYEEERFINDSLTKYTDKPKQIVLYGSSSVDESPHRKYTQLLSLGINEVWIYSGGMFEWLLLQDIYGDGEFPTTRKESDLLKWRPTIRWN